MLEKYQTLQEEISERKDGLVADREELAAMQEELKTKQSSVNSLISTTKANISQADSELTSAYSTVSDLENAIAKMEEYERQLEIQKAKEDAARLAQIKAQEQEDTSGVIYVPTDSDAYLLGAIIQCESDGEPYEGKLAVGSVVLNRVKSSYFPNTISGVIYQSGQFSPVASGRYAYRLEAGVNATCLQAANEVLAGNITLNALFFRRVNMGITEGTVIGNHIFY
jgi:spore germination cell wall hydrolase CwlJ-like protein